LKISYINLVAQVCEASGADIEKVADGVGADKRIGRAFLNAGLGYGGSCFPKDISAFIAINEELGVDSSLLKEVQKINAKQRVRFLQKIQKTLGGEFNDKRIAVWGPALLHRMRITSLQRDQARQDRGRPSFGSASVNKDKVTAWLTRARRSRPLLPSVPIASIRATP
jgi:hypothetical protein